MCILETITDQWQLIYVNKSLYILIQSNSTNSVSRSQTAITLRISMIMLDGNYLPHELLLTTRQEIQKLSKA